MTREERENAIRCLKLWIEKEPYIQTYKTCLEALEQESCEDWYDVPSNEMNLEQARQAVKDLRKKLVEHLEQEPCEDAISRQAVLDYIYNDLGLGDEENGKDVERQMDLVVSYKYVKSLPPVKFPSVAIPPDHDGCKDCKYETYPEYYYPCCECKQNYTDEWQKKPHWIEHEHEAGENWEYSRYECSECHEWSDDDSNFCPNCGAKMGGEEE